MSKTNIIITVFLTVAALAATVFVFKNATAVSDEETKAQAMTTDKIIFGVHPYWNGGDYDTYNYNTMTDIGFFAVDVAADGSISDDHGWPVVAFVDYAHARSVNVSLIARNFDAGQLTTLLSSGVNRSNAISNLLTEVQNGNADGINIDFENIPGAQRDNFTTFMTDLYTTFKAADPTYTVWFNIPSYDWNNAFDLENLVDVVDQIKIMTYDYHWETGPKAGPISPMDDSATWGTLNVRDTLQNYLDATDGATDKFVLGVPYYGYDWPTDSHNLNASTTGAGSSKTTEEAETAAGTYGRQWDPESQTPYYMYGSYQQGWYEDYISSRYKHDFVVNYDLAGVGVWTWGNDGGGTTEMSDNLDYYYQNTATRKHLNGTFVKSTTDNTIYLLDHGVLYPFQHILIFRSHDTPYVVPISPAEIAITPSQTDVYFKDGDIIKGSTDTIYIIENKLKRAFGSWQVFTDLGYGPEDIQTGCQTIIGFVDTGDPIMDAYTHTSGSVVKGSDATVYYIKNGYKRRFTDATTFLTWFNWSDIIETSDVEIAGYPTGDTMPMQDGTVFKGSGSTIWIMSAGLKHRFATWAAFSDLSYNQAPVWSVSDGVIANQREGHVIN